jgi:alpha-galactosidase
MSAALVSVLGGPSGTAPLWSYDSDIGVYAPVAEIDGKLVNLSAALKHVSERNLTSTIREVVYSGKVTADPSLALTLVMRLTETNRTVRFRYELSSSADVERRLTKSTNEGKDAFHLATVDVEGCATEVRLSDYSSMVHSYVPTTVRLGQGDFDNKRQIMGPLLTWVTTRGHAMIAYEHGSQFPDTYISYQLDTSDSGTNSVTLATVKGTYLSGHDLRRGFQTVWMHLLSVDSPVKSLQGTYRSFILYSLALNQASRTPYTFYNTWNYQERLKNWHGGPTSPR